VRSRPDEVGRPADDGARHAADDGAALAGDGADDARDGAAHEGRLAAGVQGARQARLEGRGDRGRVVHYFPKEGKYAFGFYVEGGQPHTALITAVHSDSYVNLAVFDRNGNTFPATSVQLFQEKPADPYGDYCTWMDYQKGQAAKTEALEAKLTAEAGSAPKAA
jgi:hypothetical protein